MLALNKNRSSRKLEIIGMTLQFELFSEYQDLLPTKFSYLKGTIDDLGIIKIPLKPDVKTVKQRPYLLDKILEADIIEPVEESD